MRLDRISEKDREKKREREREGIIEWAGDLSLPHLRVMPTDAWHRGENKAVILF